jgi:hypothetical protein
MTHNVHARLDVKARKSVSSFASPKWFFDLPSIDDIPEVLFRQMRSCQTAANEFLRHFWTSISPPMTDGPILNSSTSAQRATKAAKMVGYLSKTHEKVAALLQTAQQQGIDPTRVQVVRVYAPAKQSFLLNLWIRLCNLYSTQSIVLSAFIAIKRPLHRAHDRKQEVWLRY